MLWKIKTKWLCIALLVIIFTFSVQGTVAYFSTTGTATNIVTSGNIRLQIHEKTAQGTDFPTGGVYVMPGDVVSKQVSVENICQHPFFLRVKVLYGIDSQALPAQECFRLNIDTLNWQYHDGWYYYTETLQPGQITPCLFSLVEIVGEQVDNRYLGKTLSLTVTAQAVQSQNNPITDGLIYTAAGWPAE